MKILGISGSPKKEGNTSYLVKKALEEAEKLGFETEFISLAGLELNPCIACEMCKKGENCIIIDDIEDIVDSMDEADGIILGSPVYFGGVSAQLKMIMDRSRSLRANRKLKNKVGAAISVGASRNGGQETTIRQIHDYMHIQSMIVVADEFPTAHYGGTGWGSTPGDCANDEFGTMTAQNVGKKVAEVLKLINK
ncbi:multimeric flavodoxin WrbA [Methanococcus voltae]|uniref:flavodoxin family protein n=1 Tax=Methanococcus voltae TaxID=2188 RepID=UPI001AE39F81|nr:flavodoxin family protein [Methanococcus voltae]MBP2144377.1 multimeric flavodoxin WrbA [Methanococcus voltae]